jgi:peptidoglycan hydrolase-like protein with peptidoglycan-binding domain
LAAGGRDLHKALVIVPIMGWLGVGALLHQTRDWPMSKPDEGVVVVVPPRPAAAGPQAQLPRAADRIQLSRELHKELKRVGCYEGEISGVWSAVSRQAMRRFTEAVNAKLPIEEPDHVLLRLVQGQAQRVCPCPAASGEAKQPSCAPPSTAETSKPAAGETRLAEEASPQRSTPLIVGAAATTAAAAAVARPQTSTGNARPANAAAASSEEEARIARPSGPTPPADVYSTRRRHGARRAESRPPAVVQSLVRDVQRALGSFGIR